MGRGGDQLPFLELGYPSVRFTVAVEDYDHQHQDLRTQDGVTYGDTVDEMDFPYLAKVTRLNIAALVALARAPMPPAPVADAAVKTWTDVTWKAVPGAVARSEAHTSELQSLMRSSYAVCCLKKQKQKSRPTT